MLDAIIKGITLGFLLAISVGPIVFTVIKQSLNNGLKGGMAFIAGIFLSDVFLVICCNFFTQFFKVLSNYDTQLGMAGSCLLLVVGLYFLFFKKVKVAETGEQLVLFSRSDYAKMFLAGAVMNMLNPGIIVFWFVWATAYISHSLQQKLVIFGVALLIALAADIAKVVMADKLRKKLTPKNIHRINKLNGIVLIGFGVALLWGLLIYGKAGGH